MKGKNFREYNRDQLRFMTVSINDLLEDDHPARLIDRIVDRLDVSKILATYFYEGKPAYHPVMMLKILFYSYMKGIMSCRKIWDSLKFRSDYIFLSAGNFPDFRTINSFRTRHKYELPDLFTQIVLMAVELGLVDFEHLAIDGQSIHANANFNKTYNMERLKKRYEKICKGMKHILSESVDDELAGKDLERYKKLEKESRKLDALESALKKCMKEGESDPQRNTTDLQALNLKFKDNTIKPAYNHQSAVDSKHGITVAVQTVNHPDHGDDLLPLVDSAAENTEGKFQNVLADCAFVNNESYPKIDERQEEFYIPDKSFVAASRDNKSKRYKKIDFQRNDKGEVVCPAGRVMVKFHEKQKDNYVLAYYLGKSCPSCSLQSQCTKAKYRQLLIDSREDGMVKMRQKLISREGKLIYQKRQGIVEPTHGHDQKNRGWRQHHLRGLVKARLEFILMRIGSNLQKIAAHAPPNAWIFA